MPTVQPVRADDPLVAPVLAELHDDYRRLYPGLDIDAEMTRYPPAEFAPPSGAFLALCEGGDLLAAGGYRRYDGRTAELKRVWTSAGHRRRGLGRVIVDALEAHARAAGYRRIYLTTGPRQPGARALYLAAGYRALGDHDSIVAAANGPLPFEKELP